MNKKFLFAVIAATIMGNAWADDGRILTTQTYVDNADALKQDKIDTSLVDFGEKPWVSTPALVSYDAQDGITGRKIGFLTYSDSGQESDETFHPNDFGYGNGDYTRFDNGVLSARLTAVLVGTAYENLQTKIDRSGRSTYDAFTENSAGNSFSWLNERVKGTGLVTKTSTKGVVGERRIIETADVANYGTGTEIQQQIQEISIPTMGAVMAAISNNTPNLPTGTAGNVVTYNTSGQIGGSVATYTGAATYNATNDANKIPTMSGVTAWAQAKKVCIRWLDTPEHPEHNDENCLLWELPD